MVHDDTFFFVFTCSVNILSVHLHSSLGRSSDFYTAGHRFELIGALVAKIALNRCFQTLSVTAKDRFVLVMSPKNMVRIL